MKQFLQQPVQLEVWQVLVFIGWVTLMFVGIAHKLDVLKAGAR